MSRKTWSNDDIDFLTNNLEHLSIESLAKHFDVSYNSIAHKISKLGLKKKSFGFYWTNNEDSIIKQHFEYAPKNYLSNLLPNRSWESIKQRGIHFGLQRLSQDRYSIDYNFFSEWNSDVAYIIGLIAADGHIVHRNGINSLQLELSAKDKDILDKICSSLKFEKELSYIKSKNTYKLYINNTKIINDIVSKGIPYKNKTFDVAFPTNLPKEFYRDYIRGVLDGDGSIYIENDTNRLHVQFLGSKYMIESIRCNIPIDISDLSIIDIYESHSCFKLSISGKRALNILHWLYNDANMYFQRKFNVYSSYLASITSPCVQ